MSFRLKTVLGIAVIEAVTLSLLIWTSLNFLKTSNERALMEQASSTAVMLATMTTDDVLSLDLAALESFIDALLDNPGVVYGRIISISEGLLAEGGDQKALDRPFRADIDFRSVDDGVYDVESRIRVESTDYGFVQLGVGVSALQELLGAAGRRIIFLAAAEMVLTAFFSIVLGLWLTRQLGSLAEGSRQISAGRLGYQIPVRGKDELAQTASTFNRMSLDLQHSYRQLNDALEEARRTSWDLSLSEAKMRAVLDGAVDGIITIDDKGLIASFNPAAEKIFGYPSSDIIGQNVRILVPEPDKRRHNQYIRNYLRSGIAKIIGIGRETEAERKDGSTLPIDLGISEIKIGEKRLFTAIVRDISERKKNEAELEQYRENLEKRVEERTRELRDTQQQLVEQAFESGRAQLAAMMLHNIGNAVTPLATQVNTLREGIPEHLVAYIEKAYVALRDHQDHLDAYVRDDPRGGEVFAYMGELIESLKAHQELLRSDIGKMSNALDRVVDILALQQTYTPREQENRQMTDLNAMIDTALDMQSAPLEKRHISVTCDLQENLNQLMIDRGRMIQVLVNLIRNAYEAIEKRPPDGSPMSIHISSYSDGNGITIDVTDTGIGIEPDKISGLLDRTAAGMGSSGLGLYYCGLFMQNNNGTLSIHSSGNGRGTTLKLFFGAGHSPKP